MLKQKITQVVITLQCYYRYNHKDIGLSDELLKILKEHGVEMITASDAHQPSHVGTNIIDIYEKTM